MKIAAKNHERRQYAQLNFEKHRKPYVTYNLIAETQSGNPAKTIVLGAHTDSTEYTAGINDNGSGTIGMLAVAKALTNFKVKNAVRFCWWTAEEQGSLGSRYYVSGLGATEVDKIVMYLNFDMIADPNPGNFIRVGGDDKVAGNSAAGAEDITRLLTSFYHERQLNSTSIELNMQSDYAPFFERGIPVGGMVAGLMTKKTPAEAEQFGGRAGARYDACYHIACDNITNVNMETFELNTEAMAFMVGTYAASLDGFPARVKLMPAGKKHGTGNVFDRLRRMAWRGWGVKQAVAAEARVETSVLSSEP